MKELLVIKVGSTSLLDNSEQLDDAQFLTIADEIATLKHEYDIVLVTSAAVSAGAAAKHMNRYDYRDDYVQLRSFAAIGQGLILEYWRSAFAKHSQVVAQFLITNQELDIPRERNSFVNTLKHTIVNGDIAVVNENDAVADDEIRLGDNDRLAARLAAILKAQDVWQGVNLVILSDVAALFSHFGTKSQKRIAKVTDIQAAFELVGKSTSSHGSGGMLTKLLAATIAHEAGIDTYLANARTRNATEQVLTGKVGTHFIAKTVAKSALNRYTNTRIQGENRETQ